MNITISIIIATFNSAKTLRTALDSINSQTFQNWECIIVDGASKDNTIEIVKEYADKDSRFRYISEPDKGIYDAFNKGWKMAKGEWIYYLGSDDKITKEGLYKLIQYSTSDIDLLGGSVYLVWPIGRIKEELTKKFQGPHQAYLTKRRAIEKIGGFDMQYKILADFDLLTRMSNTDMKVINKNIPIAYFNVGGISQKLSSLLTVRKEGYLIAKRNKISKFPLLRAIKLTLIINIGSYIKNILWSINKKN